MQACFTLYGGQNGLYEFQQSSCTLIFGIDRLCELLGFCKLSNGQSGSHRHFALVKTDYAFIYKSITCFEVVKTNSASLYNPATCFTVFKIDSPTLYKPTTHFLMVKTDSPSFCKSYTRFMIVKVDSPSFYKPPVFPRLLIQSQEQLIH